MDNFYFEKYLKIKYLNLYNLQMMGGIDEHTLYSIQRLKNCDIKKLNSQLYEKMKINDSNLVKNKLFSLMDLLL